MGTKCPECETYNPSDSKFCKECATPLPDVLEAIHTQTYESARKELTTGSTFAGRYQVIEELGKGGMGRVYKVLDKETKEKIALKLIKPEIASDKKTVERFRNELTTARKIAQKNVCRMFDLNKEQENYYITMEYVSGGDLKKFIRRIGQLPVGKAISIGKQICEGLSEAHNLGIVHRDLKPNNIMIDDEGNARIMDFGIARTIKAKGITGSGVMIGTPEYMSPEQAEAKDIDHRSDLYSLGVVLYEMVTGKMPFEGDTPLAIAMKHKGEMPKDPKSLNPQIQDDLNGVILKCLEKDKDNRYQSAADVRSELERIEQGLPTTDRVEPKIKTLTSKEITVTFGLKKLYIPALVIVVIAVIGLIIWSPWEQKATAPVLSEIPSIAVLPFEDLSPQKDQASLCEGLAISIINSLTKIENLRIPGRGSSFSFKGLDKNYKDIASKLDVKTLLDGTLQKEGDTIRVTAELIDCKNNSVLWSEQYNGELDSILAIQDDIAHKIVEKLKIKLIGEKEDQVFKRYTENSKAFELYSQGTYLIDKRGANNVAKAIEYLKAAIAEDPDYALAYAGVADAFVHQGELRYRISSEAFPEAKTYALKALEIDSSLAEAHCTLGIFYHQYDWEWEKAEEEFKKAIELNPNYASAHMEYGEFLTRQSRFEEARHEMRRAVELNPHSLTTLAIANGWFNIYAQRYDEAIEQMQKVLQMDPDNGYAIRWLLSAQIKKGNYEEALAHYERINASYWIAYIKILEGNFEEAENYIAFVKNSNDPDFWSYQVARLYFLYGKNDEGFPWLERALKSKHSYMCYIGIEQEFDSVRSDPRFQEILKKVGLYK
ncbi:FlgO family outer membrane protein [Acidobacteriota bacterium]